MKLDKQQDSFNIEIGNEHVMLKLHSEEKAVTRIFISQINI